jgi:GNAT superfamily N-acetyltransferase
LEKLDKTNKNLQKTWQKAWKNLHSLAGGGAGLWPPFLSYVLRENRLGKTDGIQLRRLAAADAPVAAALIRAAFALQGTVTDPPSSALRETAEIVAEKLARGGGAGLERDGELIGVALWAPQENALYVGRLAVVPSWRGRGLSSRLLQEAEAEAKRRALHRLRLHARIELPANGRLFARHGFVEVEVRAHPGYAEPTFAVMEKTLR